LEGQGKIGKKKAVKGEPKLTKDAQKLTKIYKS